MRPEIFQALAKSRLEELTNILVVKGAEYATDGDRLHNFKTSARIANKSKAAVCDGFLLKQYTSYRDMLDKFDRDEPITVAMIREKFGDILTYFLIQEIIFLEKYDADELTVRFSEKGPDMRATFMEPSLGAPYDPAKTIMDWPAFVSENMENIAEALGVPVEELTRPIPKAVPHIDPVKDPKITPMQYVISVIDEHLGGVEYKGTAYKHLKMVKIAAEAMLGEEAKRSFAKPAASGPQAISGRMYISH